MEDKKYYSDVKFTARELIAILNVLKHSQQFGQSVAPEDVIHVTTTPGKSLLQTYMVVILLSTNKTTLKIQNMTLLH